MLAKLRHLWSTHRNPRWLTPDRSGTGPEKRSVKQRDRRMSPGLRDAIRVAVTEAVVRYRDPVDAAMEAYDAWDHAARPVGRQRKYESAAVRRQAYLDQQKAARAVVANVGRNGSAAKTPDISNGVGGEVSAGA
jgi:hypothetical protein